MQVRMHRSMVVGRLNEIVDVVSGSPDRGESLWQELGTSDDDPVRGIMVRCVTN